MDKEPDLREAEINVHLAEYNSLWQEVLCRFDMQKHILSLQVAVVGACVSAVAFLQSQPILYLFGGLLLGLLSCVMVEQTIRVNTMGEYIRVELTPKVQSLLPGHKFKIWQWQTNAFIANPSNMSWGFLSFVKFIIGPFIVILLCMFFYTTKPIFSNWTLSERTLFISNIVVLLVPVLIGVFNLTRHVSRPRSLKIHSAQATSRGKH